MPKISKRMPDRFIEQQLPIHVRQSQTKWHLCVQQIIPSLQRAYFQAFSVLQNFTHIEPLEVPKHSGLPHQIEPRYRDQKLHNISQAPS